MPHRLRLAVAAASIAAGVAVVTLPSTPVDAATYTMKVISPVVGRIGVDAIYPTGGGGGAYDIATCSLDPSDPVLGWNSNGDLEGTRTVPGNPIQIRFEMYPMPCGQYSGWEDVGGVHIEFDPRTTNQNLGTVVLPKKGDLGVFALHGDILSSTPITPGRVTVDSFQVPTGYPDAPAPLQQNGTVSYGAFASTASRGSQWSGGYGWAGRYNLFIKDRTTGTEILALADISPSKVPTIDLDAICFGFDICVYGKGGPTTTAGSFHPMEPTRILDTRPHRTLGIANGPVRTGDGRHPSPNPITRRDESANHELQVTGRFGIPASGVSAVLLNVTAADAPGVGYLSVLPKPQRVGDVFNDQASFGALPGTSNLNIGSNAPVPNLVLARVGAGGKIRFYNSFGPTNVIADVAGWFGTGGAHTDGTGFTGVVPARVLDTRNGIGGPRGPVPAGGSRVIDLSSVPGLPAGAESAVINITAIGGSSSGYVTAHPDGTAPPEASNVNVLPSGIRANSAVVKIGSNGRIRLLASETDLDLVVDVLGSFGDGGGTVTAIAPERLVDSRNGVGTTRAPFAPFQTRTLRVAGRGSVPANATAIVANLTATDPTGIGYLTAWPSGVPQPTSSNLNFLPGQTVPNLVMIKIGANGSIDVFNEVGSTHVLLDVMGYVL